MLMSPPLKSPAALRRRGSPRRAGDRKAASSGGFCAYTSPTFIASAAPMRANEVTMRPIKARSRRPTGVVRSMLSSKARASEGSSLRHSHISSRGCASLPQLAGEGGAKRRMGCGPLLRRKSDCTTVTANLHRSIPAFHTPSGPPGHLPRFAEKGNARAACRVDDLCECRRDQARASSRASHRATVRGQMKPGLSGMTWPVTSQSNKWRIAARRCFTVGAERSRPSCSM